MRQIAVAGFRFCSVVLSILATASASAQLPLGEPVLVNSATPGGDQQFPSVGMADDGRIRVVWTDRTANDVLVRSFAADGSPFSAAELSQADLSEFDVRISVNGSGDWVAAWGTNQVGDGGLDLFGRRTANNGSTLANESQVNATAAVDVQIPPRVARADDDSYVAAWIDDDSPGELNYRKFGGDGSAATGDLLANETNDPDIAEFDVAAAPDGGFMIVWQGGASPNQQVFGRCFDDAGVPAGAQFVVPAEVAPRNLSPNVAADARGAFTVSWVEGGSADIEWRRFAPDCAPAGGDRLAIAGGPGGGTNVELDVAPDGAIVLTWHSSELDLDGGVSVLELTKSGAAVGGEFLAHDIEAGLQGSPSVGVGSQLIAVVWQDQEGASGADDDILMQRFRRRVLFTDDFESADLFYWSASAL